MRFFIMPASKATLAVTATPNPAAAEDMQSYVSQVGPLISQYKGEVLHRGKVTHVINGEPNFAILLLAQFDSETTIRALFDSPEYAALKPARDKGFKSMNIVISTAM
jgi:uncharacterized protein (DUF1330 family)